MTVLMQSTATYRAGTVGRPRACTATLHPDRLEVVGADGAILANLPTAAITRVKVSGSAVMVTGEPFGKVGLEFITVGRKLAWGLLLGIGMLIPMYTGQARRTTLAWRDALEQVRAGAAG
ncbi:hypothetical protein [Nocardioides sp.]|uniref:hypothetical protein n=1 Tax=Nocardioides sp. TaxID=35761 RepID=UPI00351918DC